MKETPLMLASYPRAILHVDGDAFFTSVEQALVPSLRGKPVVTGKERGIIACASYEAKALGVRRGLPLFEARKLCPGLIILPSDYESYGLYSKRMFDIMRRYTPVVEEYSVDEAFADITGLRRVFRCSYDEIGRRVQEAVHRELGLTVSVGLSLSKTLAKLCSKFRKPRGFTAVPGNLVHVLLQKTPLEKVWGFGPNTVNMLQKYGLHTAYDFVLMKEHRAAHLLHKPGKDLWNELRGNSAWDVTPEEKTTYTTILKSKTFTPATGNRSFVYAKLVRNVENAFMKARRYRLKPRVLGVVLRHDDFQHNGLEAKLNRATSSDLEALPLIRKLFDRIFRDGSKYRATMIVLAGLESDRFDQYELFEDRLRIDNLQSASRAMDAINRKYGKHTLRSGMSLYLDGTQSNDREVTSPRRDLVWQGETTRQRVAVPRTNIVV